MRKKRKPDGYYDIYENCKKEALKCLSRTEFLKRFKTAYYKASENKWLDDICSHMILNRNIPNYWTKEKCQEEALKYDFRSDFNKKSKGAYIKAYRNKWLDDICTHMKVIGSLYKRLIYVYLFDDNYVYVGLTGNLNRRHLEHMRIGSPIYKHIEETNLEPKLTKLTEYIDVNTAIELEDKYVEQYKKNGFVILNSIKTGGIGGTVKKWTYNSCKEAAYKCLSKSSFKSQYKGAYKVALRNNWLIDICSHMIPIYQATGYWDTIEKCKKTAKKYNNRSDFRINESGAYNASRKNGWLDEVCSHMVEIRKPKEYWTKEKCQEEAFKYNKKVDFMIDSPTSYIKARKNGWLDEICSHM